MRNQINTTTPTNDNYPLTTDTLFPTTRIIKTLSPYLEPAGRRITDSVPQVATSE